MKGLKFLSLLLVVIMLAAFAAGCAGKPETPAEPEVPTATETPAEPEASVEPETPTEPEEPQAEKLAVSIAALKGPTGMGMVKLMSDAEAGATANDYAFTLAGSPDEVVGKLSSGEIQIAALPTNLAANLYTKTGGKVQMAAVNTLGVLYVVTTDGSVNTVADLANKNIIAAGQGSTAEYILSYILEKNGIAEEVNVKWLSEHAEVVSNLAAGTSNIAVLPEPFVTVSAGKAGTSVALDLTKEFAAAAGGDTALTMGCLVVNSDFAANNKAALDAFLDEYAASAAWVNENVQEASALIAGYEIVASPEIAAAALPNCNIVYYEGQEMADMANGFLEVLFAADPASVGGSMPDDGLYYMR